MIDHSNLLIVEINLNYEVESAGWSHSECAAHSATQL